MGGLVAVGYFLFTLFFSLLTAVLWIRIGLRYFRVSTLHPVSYANNSLTNPLITPISRLIPASKTRLSRYDWACFILLVVIEFLKFTLLSLLFLTAMMPLLLLVIYVLADLIIEPCNLLFYAIIIRVIMSWVNPAWQHPVADILRICTEPLLRLGRRIVPDVFGFDFSPFIVLVILKIITLFIRASLPLQLI